MSLPVRALSEFVGTFALVAVGTGAIAIDSRMAGLTPLAVPLAFGGVVAAMIYALGKVSGAHLNPAVTLGFWASRDIPRTDAAAYALAQCAGALTASLGLATLTPPSTPLGVTRLAVALPTGIGIEIAITFLLMFVIASLAARPKARPILGLCVGATVAFCALIAGPATGGSMNPARSLGPALVSGETRHLWVFFAAPAIGALVAIRGCRLVWRGDCCRGKADG